MTDTADVIVIGAGVQGASLAFHLASRGASVVIVERATVGRRCDRSIQRPRARLLRPPRRGEARLGRPAVVPGLGERVGGDCGFTRTGFLWIEPAERLERVTANSAAHRALGVDSTVVDADGIRRLAPSLEVGDEVAAWEPESGYADPSMTAGSLIAAAKARGARLLPERRGHGDHRRRAAA